MKWLGIVGLFLLAAIVGAFVYLDYSSRPPKEAQVIANFHVHRAAFERLRDMLEADQPVGRIAEWGIEPAAEPWRAAIPPEGDFPVGRYNEYLALLKEIGGYGAFRERGKPPVPVGIDVWGSGWASDTRHIAVCWLNKPPSNQVSSLDTFYQTPKPRSPVFRHIDGNWYLWADW
jgi:hypothetical protein